MNRLLSASCEITGFFAALEDGTDDDSGFALGRHSLQIIHPGVFGLKEVLPALGVTYVETGPEMQ